MPKVKNKRQSGKTEIFQVRDKKSGEISKELRREPFILFEFQLFVHQLVGTEHCSVPTFPTD